MGNKILTAYDVQKDPCYYSTDLKWRLHSANFKEKPEEKLTIFLFEKKYVEKYAKNSKEQILELLRRDATSLQRLRHPHLLSVIEALSEERSTMAFATRPVVGTVAQLLENNRHELSALEMKCGILDVAEAVQFLHQDAKTAHLGLGPHSIFIDPQGKWLLGGLGHSMSGMQWGQQMDCPFAFASSDPSQLSHEPPPRYAAPEMCGIPAKCGLESDIFALGLLTYELMCADRQPLLRGAPRGYSTSMIRAGMVQSDLHQVLIRICSPLPAERMTIAAFINSEFFMDVNVRAIRFLEQINEKEEAQRITFLKGLPKLLQDPQSPLCGQRVLRERVLPRLCGALLFPSLYGVVVPIIVSLLKREKTSDCAHFQAKIWPSMRPLFSAKEIPIEVVTLFLKELDLLVNFTQPAETQAVLLPFLLRCLELQEPVILNEVLEKVPFLHKKFEYRQVKDQILPRMLQLLLTSGAVKIKVQVLMGLSRIFEIFDKNTIQDVVLPAFEKLTKTDRTPAVCMCLLGCYDAMSKHLGHKVTSEKILPLICPLLVEESLSAEQWETQMTVCKKLLQRVEAARRKDYDTKREAQAEAGHALGGAGGGLDVTGGNGKPAPKEAEPQDFESLLFAGTGKARAAPVATPPAVPQAPVAPPAPATDIFGGRPGGLLDGPTPSAPSTAPAMGNFDPFASSATANIPVGPAAFDPFAALGGGSPPPAAQGLSALSSPAGGLGGLSIPAGPGQLGQLGGFGPGAPGPGGFGGGYPGAMPGLNPGPGGLPGLNPAAQPGFGGPPQNMLRNMAYDPFAEISDRAP